MDWSLMTSKKSFLIFFGILGLLSAYFIFNSDQLDSTATKTQKLADSQDSIPVQQRLGYIHKTLKQEPFANSASNNLANDIQLSVTSNDTIKADAIASTLDQLLVSNDLQEFSESLLIEVEDICQKSQHLLSELACQVLQHQIELVKQYDDENNSLESDWGGVEQNGGGIEFEEYAKVTVLPGVQKITRDSGRQGDDLESSLQTLTDRALFDSSADARFKAIQEAVLMKSEALAPLLQDALNDENLANRKLAEEGLQQLRENSMIGTDVPDNPK